MDFGLEKVQFGNIVRACNGTRNRYNSYHLYAVCNHFGSMEGGHYTAYCYSQVKNKWNKFDDQEVSEFDDPRDVKTSAAYMGDYPFTVFTNHFPTKPKDFY